MADKKVEEELCKVYVPVLEKIYQEADKFENNKINKGVPDIFIPGAGRLYDSMDKKILYIGKDTNGWSKFKKNADTYGREKNEDKKQEILKDIILKSSEALNKNEHITWWEGGRSQFWDYIFRLQTYINNINGTEELKFPSNETTDIKKEWLTNHEKVTQSFAWSNTQLLQELNIEENIKESDLYKRISELTYKKKEERAEVLKKIIEALNPDIIIILNWDEYIEFIGEYKKKVNYCDKCIAENTDNYSNEEQKYKIKIEYYQLKDGRHVFWTYHPRAALNKGGVEIWVQAMFKFMKDEHVI